MSKSLTPIATLRAGLAALNIEEQKTVFDALPAIFQAALWQDRLREGMSVVHDKAQFKILSNLCDLLSSDGYSDAKENEAAKKYIDELTPRIEQVFPDQSLFQRYTQYLGDKPCIDETVVKGKGGLPTCVCSSDRSCMLRHNDCGALLECLTGNCTRTRVGCGILWLQSCDGLCTGDFC